MPDWQAETEDLVYHGRIKVPYQWWVGETGSRFLLALRDEKKFYGTFCPSCQKVFIPPRKVCGRCFSTQMDWREVGPDGILLSYTTIHYHEDIHPMEDPITYGLIKLDGADTALPHLLGEFEAGRLKVGLRVGPVFKEDRQGHILDIRYFKPLA